MYFSDNKNLIVVFVIFVLSNIIFFPYLSFANKALAYRYELFFENGNIPYTKSFVDISNEYWVPITKDRKLRFFSYGDDNKTRRTEPVLIKIGTSAKINNVQLKQNNEEELIPAQIFRKETIKDTALCCSFEFLYDNSNSDLIITILTDSSYSITIPLSNMPTSFDHIYTVTPGYIDHEHHYTSKINFVAASPNIVHSDMLMISYPSQWVKKYIQDIDHLDNTVPNMFSKKSTLEIGNKQFDIIPFTCERTNFNKYVTKNCFYLNTYSLDKDSFSAGSIDFSKIFPDLECPSIKHLPNGICRNLKIEVKEVIHENRIVKIVYNKDRPNILIFIPGCYEFNDENIVLFKNALTSIRLDLKWYKSACYYYCLTKKNEIVLHDISDHKKIDKNTWDLLSDVSHYRHSSHEKIINQLKNIDNENFDKSKPFSEHLYAFMNEYFFQSLKDSPTKQVTINGDLHLIILLPEQFEMSNENDALNLLKICNDRKSFIYFHFVLFLLDNSPNEIAAKEDQPVNENFDKSVEQIYKMLGKPKEDNRLNNKHIHFYSTKPEYIDEKIINYERIIKSDILKSIQEYRISRKKQVKLLLKNNKKLSIPSIFEWDVLPAELQIKSNNSLTGKDKNVCIPIISDHYRKREQQTKNNIKMLPQNSYELYLQYRKDLADDLKLLKTTEVSLNLNVKKNNLNVKKKNNQNETQLIETQLVEVIKQEPLQLKPVIYYQNYFFISYAGILFFLVLVFYLYSFIMYEPELLLNSQRAPLRHNIDIPLNGNIIRIQRLFKPLMLFSPRTQILKLYKNNQKTDHYPLWQLSKNDIVCELSDEHKLVFNNWIRKDLSHLSTKDDNNVTGEAAEKAIEKNDNNTTANYRIKLFLDKSLNFLFLLFNKVFFRESINLNSALTRTYSIVLFGMFVSFISLASQYVLLSFEIKHSSYFMGVIFISVCYFVWIVPILIYYIINFKINKLDNIKQTYENFKEKGIAVLTGIISNILSGLLKEFL